MHTELDDRATGQPVIRQNAIQGLYPERKAGICGLTASGRLADADAMLAQRGSGQAFEKVCGQGHSDTEHNNSLDLADQ
jgi:hypothetical protein